MARTIRTLGLAALLLSAASLIHAQTEEIQFPDYVDENLVKVLRTTNKAQTNKYVCAALEFKNVNPFNVINFFWAVTSREEGGIYSFVHPTEERGYLVVMCPEYQLPYLQELARQLDRPKLTSAPGSKYIYYRMKHRNIADANYRQVLSYYVGSSGVLLPDVETNSVVIFDAPAGADYMQAALQDLLDKPLSQVEMAVKIYEVDVINDGTLGADYIAWKNGPGKVLLQYSGQGEYFNTKSGQHVSTTGKGSGFYLDYPSAFFDFLVEKGKAISLTDTKITAINRVPAMLTTGEQITYFEVTNPATNRELHERAIPAAESGLAFPTNGDVLSGGNPRTPFGSVWRDGSYPLGQFAQDGRPISSCIRAVDTGVSVAIVPTIGEKMINMNLELKVVNVTGYDGTGVPLLAQRQIRDSIAVADGDEVVFGGLTRARSNRRRRFHCWARCRLSATCSARKPTR